MISADADDGVWASYYYQASYQEKSSDYLVTSKFFSLCPSFLQAMQNIIENVHRILHVATPSSILKIGKFILLRVPSS